MTGVRADLMANLYRAAAALEHADQHVRIALVSTDLIAAGEGEWSEPVRYRIREDAKPGVAQIDLKTEPEQYAGPKLKARAFGGEILEDEPMLGAVIAKEIRDGTVVLVFDRGLGTGAIAGYGPFEVELRPDIRFLENPVERSIMELEPIRPAPLHETVRIEKADLELAIASLSEVAALNVERGTPAEATEALIRRLREMS